MNVRDAVAMIAGAVPAAGGTWADLGAGEGVFTRALAKRIGPQGTVYAVERDAQALSVLNSKAQRERLAVIPVLADITADFELPGLGPARLAGVLFANSLHYVRDAAAVLARMAGRLEPGGRIVIVEYDQHDATRWVPYPVPPARFAELAARAGLSAPSVTATRPSAFGGTLYVATAASTTLRS